VERLVKNVLAGRPLARVNAFVDLYNAVSLKSVLPLGADDLDKITPPLAFRYAREGDSFVDMAEGGEEVEAPRPGEVVYADAAHVLCRRWNWRQDSRTLITPATRRAVVTVQANGAGDVAAGAADLIDLIEIFCGGQAHVEILDAQRRSAEL
jgi:DNA/RNA-binding domain of Phe-tRNA-synthetase-like protein